MSASSPSPSSAAAATAAPMSLKQRIHNFKIPLSPRGLRIARIVYFTAPLVIGVIVMQAAMGYEEHHRDEWVPSGAERESEVERTQQQMAVLKQVANDPQPRLP